MSSSEHGGPRCEKDRYWRGHIDTWCGSGLSQAEYSRRAEVSAQGLSY